MTTATTPVTATLPPLYAAYNDSDIYGSQGLWVEGNSIGNANATAEIVLRECGFELGEGIEVTVENLRDLASLDEDEFDRLASQWGLSVGEAWTSRESDKLIRAEYVRRQAADEDFEVFGWAAKSRLSRPE